MMQDLQVGDCVVGKNAVCLRSIGPGNPGSLGDQCRPLMATLCGGDEYIVGSAILMLTTMVGLGIFMAQSLMY